MKLERDVCIRALNARDPRFDGVFFVGVTSTGIYCRPVCPAKPPRRDRCRFFENAAAAERMGFRPCLRCRPELAPGMAAMDAGPRVAHVAAQRIAEGALNDGTVDDLAKEFAITGRQLRRVVEKEVGASPVELAQTHRLLMAKRLLTDTTMPMTQVAFASGFQSVRRFDALFQSRYRLTPSRLRKRAAGDASATTDAITLTLGFRPPLPWSELLAFLAAHATPGVEAVEGDAYLRTVHMDGRTGWIRVQPLLGSTKRAPRMADHRSLRVEISATLTPVLMPLLARLRELFDLDADPESIGTHLSANGLREHVAACPGMRVPGTINGFDLALRAVLGQQVSVKGATTIAGRFAEKFGETIVTPFSGLTRTSPIAGRVANASVTTLRSLGITGARAECVLSLAAAVVDGRVALEPRADAGRTIAALVELSGIGDWTAQYIAMRALRWPDGFPASDLWLRREAGGISAARLVRVAERWRPWRAYAAMHLWHGIGAGRALAMPE